MTLCHVQIDVQTDYSVCTVCCRWCQWFRQVAHVQRYRGYSRPAAAAGSTPKLHPSAACLPHSPVSLHCKQSPSAEKEIHSFLAHIETHLVIQTQSHVNPPRVKIQTFLVWICFPVIRFNEVFCRPGWSQSGYSLRLTKNRFWLALTGSCLVSLG